MVRIESWDGKAQERFVEVVKTVLCPLLGEVVIHVPHGNNDATVNDGLFHIFIWSSPRGSKSTTVPESIWGTEVDCTDEGFTSTGEGVSINDESYCVAELIGHNLFVHHDLVHHGTDNEVAIFSRLMSEVIDVMSFTTGAEEVDMDDAMPTAARIRKSLSEEFVFSAEVARILSICFAGDKNCIIFGPAGHGKSEMVQSVIDGLGIAKETFFQFFGEGMDEARLFGGLDFRKLEKEKVLEYFPEKSFLNYRVAVFEELFDAPASVLLALKDTLTARELRNGSQKFKMRTELIICLTNREPGEISELGPAAHALVERFPLQLNLKWKDYSSASYLAMFEKVADRMEGPVLNGFKSILAEIIAKAVAEGNFISPRTAMHAFSVCQAAAKLRGGDHVTQRDLTDLRFVDGLEGLAETLEADLKAAMERAEAEKQMRNLIEEFNVLKTELARAETPIKALQAAKRFGQLENKLANVRVPDTLTDKRNNMRESVARKISEANAKALDLTRV